MPAVFSSAEYPPSARPDDDVARLRIPPHSVEAEQSVLGGLLLDNGAWDRVGDLLTESDFYRFEHRLIYAATSTLVNAASRPTSSPSSSGCRAWARPRTAAVSLPQRRWRRACRAPQHPRYAEIVRERSVLRKRSPPRRDRDQPSIPGSAGGADPRRGRGQDLPHGEEGSRSRQGFQSMDALVVQLIDRVTSCTKRRERGDRGAAPGLRPRPPHGRAAGRT